MATSAAGPHRGDAGRGERLAGLDRNQPAVGDRRAHDAHVQLIGKADVGRETAGAGEERPVLEPRHRPADDGHQRIFAAAALTALRMFW